MLKVSASQLKTLEPKEKPYKVGAGGALYLLVMPTGAKYWRFKYRIGGREKNLALGVYPDVSLAEAQEAQNKAKLLLKDGIDPSAAKREQNKERAKPKGSKAVFRMDMSPKGELAVETDTRMIRLTKAQTEALHSFLIASFEGMEA